MRFAGVPPAGAPGGKLPGVERLPSAETRWLISVSIASPSSSPRRSRQPDLSGQFIGIDHHVARPPVGFSASPAPAVLQHPADVGSVERIGAPLTRNRNAENSASAATSAQVATKKSRHRLGQPARHFRRADLLIRLDRRAASGPCHERLRQVPPVRDDAAPSVITGGAVIPQRLGQSPQWLLRGTGMPSVPRRSARLLEPQRRRHQSPPPRRWCTIPHGDYVRATIYWLR